jgi:hypothetical protein
VTGETRVTGIGAPSPLHLSRQIAAALTAGRPGSPRLAVTMPTPEIVDALNGYQPDAPAPFALLPEVVQYQIVHRSPELLVRVVPRRRSDLVARVGAAVRRAVADAGARIDVSIVAVDRIEREPGHAAKVKLVVSETPPPG